MLQLPLPDFSSFHSQIYPRAIFPVHAIGMSLDDRTAQQHLTPEKRRELLRAFADRMLLKVIAMDDPKDMPGVEKAIRTAAMIERVYSRCDRAERQLYKTPDPRKLEAERAVNAVEAIKAHVNLANTLKWGEERRLGLGQWWEAAQNVTQTAVNTPPQPVERVQPLTHTVVPHTETAPAFGPKVTYLDLTDDIEAFRAELALQRREAAKSAQGPRPPLRGPP